MIFFVLCKINPTLYTNKNSMHPFALQAELSQYQFNISPEKCAGAFTQTGSTEHVHKTEEELCNCCPTFTATRVVTQAAHLPVSRLPITWIQPFSPS